jgi:peptide/nickel transport system ATP-binding protein
MAQADEPILKIENLSISFFTRDREIPAVMDFSVQVRPGEAVGLVGESRLRQVHRGAGVMRDMGATGRIVGGRVRSRGAI